MLVRALVVCAALSAAIAPAHAELQPWENTAARASDIDALYAFMRQTHPDLYHHTKQAEMEVHIAKFKAGAKVMSWPRYVVGVYRFVSLVGDGHSALFPMPEGPGFDTRLPLLTEAFSDGLYVIGADEAYRDAVGKKVLAIGGKPTADVVATLTKIWPHENEIWAVRWLPFMVRRPAYLHGAEIASGDMASPITYTILDNGARRDIAVKPIAAAEDTERQKTKWTNARDEAKRQKPTPLHGTDSPFGFHHLKDRKAVYAVYRQSDDAEKETVEAFAARLFKFVADNPVERLIIDVRENGGGNNYKNQALLLAIIKSKVDHPGALFVLTGRQTFSAAQNFVNHAERWTQAMFVGEPAGSSPNHFGDARPFQLPATKISVIIASLRWQDSDPQDSRPWIMPDIVARETLADYTAGRDVALDAALAYRVPANHKATDPFKRWQSPLHWIKTGDTYTPRAEFKFDW